MQDKNEEQEENIVDLQDKNEEQQCDIDKNLRRIVAIESKNKKLYEKILALKEEVKIMKEEIKEDDDAFYFLDAIRDLISF